LQQTTNSILTVADHKPPQMASPVLDLDDACQSSRNIGMRLFARRRVTGFASPSKKAASRRPPLTFQP